MKAVVDTNVPAVASHPDGEFPRCVAACVRRLVEFMKTGTLVLDDGRRILTEYMRQLRSSGQPGIGDVFLKWVLTNLQNPRRCSAVSITPVGNTGQDFAEFPSDPRLALFDPDDRKFVAVARAHQEHPPILQALDSDWWGVRDVLKDNGVTVDFLCPDAIQALHDRKRR